jgi:integrase/recombinase XerD
VDDVELAGKWPVLGRHELASGWLRIWADLGRAPRTIDAYARGLAEYLDVCERENVDPATASRAHVAVFVRELTSRPSRRGPNVVSIDSGAGLSNATIQQRLSAVSAFYAHQARNGAGVGDLLAAWRVGGRGDWKPFLHHISKDTPYRGRAIALKAPKKLPRILTPAEMQAILDACTRLRDRFFFALLHESGCRAGEALGLRHEDIAAAECEITIVARENANGARAKSGGRTVPVGPDLIRLYADYLHEEYGDCPSDYVFINVWAEPKGQAWAYQAAYDLVLRLRARTGIDFDPHWCRHSAATRWLRDGVPIEVVSALLGHSSVAVTSSVYGHLTAGDARAALEKAGWLTGKEVAW